MSHFTEVKSKISNLDLLKSSLDQLNLKFNHHPNGVDVRGFVGDVIQCDFSIDTGTKYDIGLKLGKDGNYEFIADWDMLQKTNAVEIRDSIMQKYSHLNVLKNLEEQGYEVEEEVNEKGEIQLKVSQWT